MSEDTATKIGRWKRERLTTLDTVLGLVEDRYPRDSNEVAAAQHLLTAAAFLLVDLPLLDHSDPEATRLVAWAQGLAEEFGATAAAAEFSRWTASRETTAGAWRRWLAGQQPPVGSVQ